MNISQIIFATALCFSNIIFASESLEKQEERYIPENFEFPPFLLQTNTPNNEIINENPVIPENYTLHQKEAIQNLTMSFIPHNIYKQRYKWGRSGFRRVMPMSSEETVRLYGMRLQQYVETFKSSKRLARQTKTDGFWNSRLNNIFLSFPNTKKDELNFIAKDLIGARCYNTFNLESPDGTDIIDMVHKSLDHVHWQTFYTDLDPPLEIIIDMMYYKPTRADGIRLLLPYMVLAGDYTGRLLFDKYDPNAGLAKIIFGQGFLLCDYFSPQTIPMEKLKGDSARALAKRGDIPGLKPSETKFIMFLEWTNIGQDYHGNPIIKIAPQQLALRERSIGELNLTEELYLIANIDEIDKLLMKIKKRDMQDIIDLKTALWERAIDESSYLTTTFKKVGAEFSPEIDNLIKYQTREACRAFTARVKKDIMSYNLVKNIEATMYVVEFLEEVLENKDFRFATVDNILSKTQFISLMNMPNQIDFQISSNYLNGIREDILQLEKNNTEIDSYIFHIKNIIASCASFDFNNDFYNIILRKYALEETSEEIYDLAVRKLIIPKKRNWTAEWRGQKPEAKLNYSSYHDWKCKTISMDALKLNLLDSNIKKAIMYAKQFIFQDEVPKMSLANKLILKTYIGNDFHMYIHMYKSLNELFKIRYGIKAGMLPVKIG